MFLESISEFDMSSVIGIKSYIPFYNAEVTQLARASAFQAESCGFEPRLPLKLTINKWQLFVKHLIGVQNLI